MAFSGVAKANLGFDFSDDPPDVITPGDDHDGRDDGNCVGSGCDDREGPGRDYDDQGDHDSDRDDRDYGDRDNSGWDERDRGHHGMDKPSSRHYGFDTDKFIRAATGSILPISGLVACAATYTCIEKGYGRKFWEFEGAAFSQRNGRTT